MNQSICIVFPFLLLYRVAESPIYQHASFWHIRATPTLLLFCRTNRVGYNPGFPDYNPALAAFWQESGRNPAPESRESGESGPESGFARSWPAGESGEPGRCIQPCYFFWSGDAEAGSSAYCCLVLACRSGTDAPNSRHEGTRGLRGR